MNFMMGEGKHIAAFFDLDGTLVAEPTLEKSFFQSLRKSGAIRWSGYLWWVIQAVRLMPRGILAVRNENKFYLRRIRTEQVFLHGCTISLFEEGIERVVWHLRHGHEIVLLSGTLEPLAKLAVMALECELEARGMASDICLCATRLEEKAGRWTGRMVGEVMQEEEKVRAMVRIARSRGIELRESHAYGNSATDRWMLAAVRCGHAVNPGAELAKIANERNWPIWRWQQERSVVPERISGRVGKIQTMQGRV
jgi:HAD superfamily phosphoserine phosphatase-like hydrolase